MSLLSPTTSLTSFDTPSSLFDTASLATCGESTGVLVDTAANEGLPAVRSTTKRVMDVVGASLGLILLGPLMLAIAAIIRLDSRGPVLFRQVRLGRNGRPFQCLKFRTMAIDAEQRLKELEKENEVGSGVLFKMKHDPRVTRIGRFLRSTSIDELPQLINVLKGEMSLVGPRPLQLRDCQRLYSLDMGRFAQRLAVPSGLTGAWQVGGRSQLDADDMLRLDLDYIANWSIGLDIQIILRTVVVVLAGRGAY